MMRVSRRFTLRSLALAWLLALLGPGEARTQEPAGAQPPAAAQPAAEAQAASAAPAQYAGSELCAACHEPVAQELERTVHGQRGFHELSEHGCETCHGPAAAHTENPDDPALQPRLDRFSPEQRNETCQGCHSAGTQAMWKGSHHESQGLSCDSCHSVHEPKSSKAQLKVASTTELCSTCHMNVRAELWKTSHHPVREGKMSCNDCHNPHGSTSEGMLTAASANELCYACHTEKRGPFLWEHPPVREDCMSCHAPHGSNHLRLQRTSVPYICQQCHLNTRHPGTLYDATRLPTLENPATGSNRLFNRACLDCHVAVHGSNHPSGQAFGR